MAEASGEKRPSDLVDGERLWQRHMELARCGARSDGGVNRLALSPEEAEARAMLVEWGRRIGLRPYTDAAANLFLRLDGRDPDAAPVLSGSHIDSQPTGGKFDGAFGVLAALEAVEAIVAGGRTPLRPIEVVAWMNEEGSRFSPGMAGSEAYTGVKPLDVLLDVRDADGVSVREAVAQIHAGDVDVPLRPLGRPVHAFIEGHIEQADALQRAGKVIGIVTGIQGTRRYRVTVTGEAAHAGTALRRDRKDALMAAARMVCAIDEAAREPDDLKLTVGLFDVFPNAPSVVPEKVFFAVDVRHNDTAVVDRMDGIVRAAVEREKGPCTAALKQIAHAPSLDFSGELRAVLSQVAAGLDLPMMDVYSAAGHDARQLHYFCPTAMFFIPCRDGISHNPNEWAEPAHVTAGARLLADTLWRIADKT